MTIAKNLTASFLLALGVVATGCAADQPNGDGGGGGDDGGGGGDDDGGPIDTTPMDASGKYTMRSTFDLATNAPGTAGQVVNTIIAITDGESDPADWLLEQAIKALPSGSVKDLLNDARPFVAGYVNDALNDAAPAFLTSMITMGHDMGEVAKNFSLNETIELTGSPGAGYTASHNVVGVHLKIDRTEQDHAFADFGVPEIAVSNVGITVDQTGKLTIADHKVGLRYGQVLRVALDGAIIPALDPSASNLGELFTDLVDCTRIGEAINDYVVDTIGFGPGKTIFATACRTGLNAGANFIYSKIDQIDGTALEFSIAGTAKALDKNGDHKLDTIQTGKWQGSLSYGGTPSALSNATFFGARM